jgi:hypothetical protein
MVVFFPGRGGIGGYSGMWQCELAEALGMGGRRTTKAKRVPGVGWRTVDDFFGPEVGEGWQGMKGMECNWDHERDWFGSFICKVVF